MVAGLLAVMLVASYYPALKVQYREIRQKARLEAELTALKARNERLRTDVARLKTKEGVEDLARTQLGLVKKGEHVAVIVDEDDVAGSDASPVAPKIDNEVPTAQQQPAGRWTAFLDAVFGVEQ